MMKFLNNKKWVGLLAALPPYIPLEPLPGGTSASYNSLSAYLNLVFKILISIGAMIAVITLVLGGISYMVSESLGTKSEARKRIQAAIIGLLLLLTCWLILNEINPTLTQFSLPGIDNAAPVGTTYGAVNAPASGAHTVTQSDISNCEGTSANPTGKHISGYNDNGTPICQ